MPNRQRVQRLMQLARSLCACRQRYHTVPPMQLCTTILQLHAAARTTLTQPHTHHPHAYRQLRLEPLVGLGQRQHLVLLLRHCVLQSLVALLVVLDRVAQTLCSEDNTDTNGGAGSV